MIRPPTEADLPAMLAITRRAWSGVNKAELRETRHGIVGDMGWAEHKCAEVERGFREAPADHVVAEVEGAVVGYIHFSYHAAHRIGMIGNNAVDPAYQNRGIGTRLVQHAMQALQARGARILEVTTLVHDTPARRVYERVGFVELARSIHYTMEVE